MPKPQTYEAIVGQIKRQWNITIEARFSIGELVDKALAIDSSLAKLREATGHSPQTLALYRATWLLWGTERIPNDHTWWHYSYIASWKERDAALIAKAELLSGVTMDAIWEKHRAAHPVEFSIPSPSWHAVTLSVQGALRDMEKIKDQPLPPAKLRP